MAHNGYPRTIADLGPGDHLCCLYETGDEHRAVLTPFLRQGLERGEKVVYIIDAHTAETVLGYLLDVETYLARGQLVILTCDDTYLRKGIFDPDSMINLLRAETDRALGEGYSALRVACEMTWALRGLPGSERLIEYEARLGEFFPGSKCLAICQYDRRRFDPEVLLDVLRTHPVAVIGEVIYNNPYYMPPAEFLGGDLPGATLCHWVQNLAEHRRSEELLQGAARQWRTTFDAIGDAVSLIDLQGRILRCNMAMTDLLGKPFDEIIGRTCWELMHGTPEPMERYPIVRMRESRCRETLVLPMNGRWLEVSADPLLNEDGNLIGSVHVMADITRRKRAEEKLRQSYVQLQRTLEGTVNTLVSAIEIRDPYTAGHQRRVAQLASAIANEMGLPEEQIEGIRMAGLIHDIGKITVPAEVLSRPGPLSKLEYGLIKTHPQGGHDVLKTIEFPWPVAQIVLQHHERMDGSGYPQGLSGEDILPEARILAVADVVEAMDSNRPYRPPRELDKALEEISQNRGVLYDPEAVDACLKLFTKKGFMFE